MSHYGRSIDFRIILSLVLIFGVMPGLAQAGGGQEQPAAAMGLVIDWLPVKGALVDPIIKSNESASHSPEALGGCNWTASTVYPIPLLDQAMASVGGNLYVFGGVSTAIVAAANKFDGAVWSSIAPLPVALEYPTAVSDGTNIYIVGGAEASAGTPQPTLYRYNVGANTYTPLAPFATGTWNQAAVYLGGKIYKFAGTGPSTASTNVLEIYDVASNTWSSGAPYPLLISFVSAWTDGIYVYGAGGIQSVGSVASLKTYRYDPAANTWDDAVIADLPQTRWAAAATANTQGAFADAVLAGGYVNGTATANISSTAVNYELASNTWISTLPNMVVGERSRMGGAELNGRFYVVGGRSVASSAFAGTNSNQQLLCTADPVINPAGSSLVAESCTPANAAIDPGEFVMQSFCVTNTGLTDTTNLVATLQASGGVTSPGAAQPYGVVVSGAPAVCHDHTFIADAALTCGDAITASIQFQDGTLNLGTVAYNFVTGVLTPSIAEKFDAVVAPALPAGWVSTVVTGPILAWVTTTNTPDTAPNAAFVNDPAGVGLSELETPPFVVSSAADQLTFRNKYITENTFDGGVLEINIAGGGYQDIVTAGGSFVSGGYTGALSTSFQNPLMGRMAWSGTSTGGYLTTVVNLPASAVGQSVRLKWRMGSDTSVAATGWWIDSVSLAHRVCSVICDVIFADGFEVAPPAAWTDTVR